MKGIAAVVILLTCPTGIYAQTQLSNAYPLPQGMASPKDAALVLQANFGYTFVDVSKAMDIPEYDPITGSGLEEWNNFNFHGIIQLLFKKSEAVSYGPEVGFNRLYYCREKETPIGLSPRWYWGTIWTAHAGGIIRFNVQENLYFLTGASLHIFLDGSGATLGIPAAAGFEVSISSTITMPIEFRTDVIFGNNTPVGIGAGLGLKFNFR